MGKQTPDSGYHRRMEPNDETEPQEKTEFEKFQELGKHLFALPKSAADNKSVNHNAEAPKEEQVCSPQNDRLA